MKVHQTIGSFLNEVGLPNTKLESFYVVRFEDNDIELNYEEYIYSHRFFEISLVMGYDANVKVGYVKRNIMRHNLICVSPNQDVTWKLEGHSLTPKSYMLIFSPEILSNDDLAIFSSYFFFNRYTNSLFELTDEQIQYLSECFDRMLDEYAHVDGDSEAFLAAYLRIVLIYLKRSLNNEQNLLYQGSRTHQVAMRFEQLVYAEEYAKRPMRYYADKLHISSVYLGECIKKATDRTYSEIINEHMILRAKAMLRSEELSVVQVADKLGFSEPSNFVKYFKKHSGFTPKQFQQQDSST